MQGYYREGWRIGAWNYDCFLDKNTPVKGQLRFEEGQNNGRLEFYKVVHHATFGTEETLAGIGRF